MTNSDLDLIGVSPQEWESFRACRFIRRIFRPYPCLAVYDDESGVTASQPYRGQSFDPALLTLIDDGWDHEHCEICRARITDGMEYWTNDGSEHVDLCLACFPKLQHEMDPVSN